MTRSHVDDWRAFTNAWRSSTLRVSGSKSACFRLRTRSLASLLESSTRRRRIACMCSPLSEVGQGDVDRRASLDLALDGDSPTEPPHDAVHERQTDADPVEVGARVQ